MFVSGMLDVMYICSLRCLLWALLPEINAFDFILICNAGQPVRLIEKRCIVSRKPPDMAVNLRPTSERSEMPVEFIGQRVSRARGWNKWDVQMLGGTSRLFQ